MCLDIAIPSQQIDALTTHCQKKAIHRNAGLLLTPKPDVFAKENHA
ncbi:MAG: hypothetical protein HXY26_10545 [Hydrogenophilaceae bacterium]|nr:hypothetical protein [Hydrogenophilaceae bacterium]